jgi:hypothetical protein
MLSVKHVCIVNLHYEYAQEEEVFVRGSSHCVDTVYVSNITSFRNMYNMLSYGLKSNISKLLGQRRL